MNTKNPRNPEETLRNPTSHAATAPVLERDFFFNPLRQIAVATEDPSTILETLKGIMACYIFGICKVYLMMKILLVSSPLCFLDKTDQNTTSSF